MKRQVCLVRLLSNRLNSNLYEICLFCANGYEYRIDAISSTNIESVVTPFSDLEIKTVANKDKKEQEKSKQGKGSGSLSDGSGASADAKESKGSVVVKNGEFKKIFQSIKIRDSAALRMCFKGFHVNDVQALLKYLVGTKDDSAVKWLIRHRDLPFLGYAAENAARVGNKELVGEIIKEAREQDSKPARPDEWQQGLINSKRQMSINYAAKGAARSGDVDWIIELINDGGMGNFVNPDFILRGAAGGGQTGLILAMFTPEHGLYAAVARAVKKYQNDNFSIDMPLSYALAAGGLQKIFTKIVQVMNQGEPFDIEETVKRVQEIGRLMSMNEMTFEQAEAWTLPEVQACISIHRQRNMPDDILASTISCFLPRRLESKALLVLSEVLLSHARFQVSRNNLVKKLQAYENGEERLKSGNLLTRFIQDKPLKLADRYAKIHSAAKYVEALEADSQKSLLDSRSKEIIGQHLKYMQKFMPAPVGESKLSTSEKASSTSSQSVAIPKQSSLSGSRNVPVAKNKSKLLVPSAPDKDRAKPKAGGKPTPHPASTNPTKTPPEPSGNNSSSSSSSSQEQGRG
jgi:hypothetical protein